MELTLEGPQGTVVSCMQLRPVFRPPEWPHKSVQSITWRLLVQTGLNSQERKGSILSLPLVSYSDTSQITPSHSFIHRSLTSSISTVPCQVAELHSGICPSSTFTPTSILRSMLDFTLTWPWTSLQNGEREKKLFFLGYRRQQWNVWDYWHEHLTGVAKIQRWLNNWYPSC